MRKSWVRVSAVAVGALAVIGSASAQSNVSFWYNQLGDPSGNQPGVINVTAGSDITLSIYSRTTGIGPLAAVGVLFGYSTTTTSGSSAVRSDAGSPLATYVSSAVGQADGTFFVTPSEGGGGGPADGVSRPYGLFATMVGPGGGSSSFGSSTNNDGQNFHDMDVTLHISASDAGGTNIGLNIWSFGTNDFYASSVLGSSPNFTEYFPSSPYAGTLHVVGTPEPASMAVLGLGVLALVRRRRRSK